ncbi:MAG: hypothetical protein KJ731_01885, partial [Alphaproteobacteria bacterium]|nr:hypothetical protein [Alphaproteobacteria bacterium]MBU1827219.1 hypothetical protein [Alphaproteobacteria bacterium]
MAETSNGGLEVEYGITLNKLVKQLASAEARMAKTAKRAEVGFANSNSKITRGFNEANNAANNFSKFGMRNASMQLSQVAQQGAVTGNYLQALAIQLPDLALGFGTVGIMAGALAPILFNVAKGYFDGLGKAVKLSDATKTLGESLESYRGYAVLAATDTAILKDKFGEFADQIKGFSEYMAGVSLGQSMDDLKATVTPLQDGLSGALDLVNQMKEAQLALIKIEGQAAQGFATSEQILMSREALDAISSAADDAAGDLGLTTDQIFSLHEAIQELSTASGMDEMRDSASKAFRLITAMYPAGEKLPAPLREAAGELEKMAKKAVGTKTEIENAGTAGKLLS